MKALRFFGRIDLRKIKSAQRERPTVKKPRVEIERDLYPSGNVLLKRGLPAAHLFHLHLQIQQMHVKHQAQIVV